jgi:hypothetical protein
MLARAFFLYILTCLMLAPVQAETLNIIAERDATLIEDSNGALANGAGPSLFAGRTGQSAFALRRSLIRFDVAAHLPARALVDRVFLSLYQTSNSNTALHTVSVHRVLQDWSEGPAFSSGGGGAPAGPGDVTWMHTDYDLEYWVRTGGHFVSHPAASEIVGGAGFYTWQSGPGLVSDVRRWLHAPRRNFGWLIKGDEDSPRSAKRFASREAMNADQHPVLTIEYHLPGE